MIINLLTGPRNVSTALMYSFAQRPDTKVIDEPLYGYYLKQTGIEHPGREEIIESMDTDALKIISEILQQDHDLSVIFIKNMSHHFIDLPSTLLLPFKNVFLIRNPLDMLPSLSNKLSKPSLRDTALKHQWTLFTQLEEMGKYPLVIDAEILLNEPLKILKILCSKLEIPFYNTMLRWDKGPRKEDGIWAKHWYHKVHNSDGFYLYEKKNEPFPEFLNELLLECRPYYNNLFHFALK